MPDYTSLDPRIESELAELLRRVSHALPAKDSGDAADFIAAGEFGLALETIAGGLVYRHKGISADIARQIEVLAASMQLIDRPFVSQIRQAVGG